MGGVFAFAAPPDRQAGGASRCHRGAQPGIKAHELQNRTCRSRGNDPTTYYEYHECCDIVRRNVAPLLLCADDDRVKCAEEGDY